MAVNHVHRNMPVEHNTREQFHVGSSNVQSSANDGSNGFQNSDRNAQPQKRVSAIIKRKLLENKASSLPTKYSVDKTGAFIAEADVIGGENLHLGEPSSCQDNVENL
jgi:hypothetical protein